MHDAEDTVSRLDIGVWRRMFAKGRQYTRTFIGVAAWMGLLALLETLTPLLTRYAIDGFVAGGTLEGLPIYIAVYVAVMVLQALAIRQFLLGAGRVEIGLAYDIRREGFDRLQELPFSYYDRTAAGWILARMTSDTGRLSEILAWGIVDIAWGGMSVLAISIAMLLLDWRLALLALSVVPPLALASVFFQRRMLASQRDIRKINSRITGAFSEGISGARTTKTLTRETRNESEFEELAQGMFKASVRAAVLSSFYLPVVSLLGAAGAALVIWRGGSQVLQGVLMLGTLYAFVAYVTRFFEPVRHIARIFMELQAAQAAAERVMGLLAEKPAIVDRPDVLERYGTDPAAWPPMQGRIEFDDVSFSYEGGETVLSGFNLVVEPGQTVALVGETGAGKSTIVNLACRFYEPTSGTIRIDGQDYRDYPLLWLYSNLGYVLQSPHLFSGTIADNIRYAKLSATDEEVRQAARLASAHDFIERMEKGYGTEVGEGGSRLSTGEKQLVSFARAILADPRLVVLDEATSSVDTETERLIQEAIHSVLSGRTAFVVAHRLSTIRRADRILVIEKGRIVEDGTHRDLMRHGGRYRELYMNQFVGEVLGRPAESVPTPET